jgi:hypothetical protein
MAKKAKEKEIVLATPGIVTTADARNNGRGVPRVVHVKSSDELLEENAKLVATVKEQGDTIAELDEAVSALEAQVAELTEKKE